MRGPIITGRERETTSLISRRGAMKALGAVAGVALAGNRVPAQQGAAPPTVISNPPPDFSQPPTYFTDPDITIVADKYDGKHLNSPNDVVAHPDGSIWFTDPPYGGQMFEGQPDAAGTGLNAAGHINPRIGTPPEMGTFHRELPTGVYRVDPSARVDLLASEDVLPDPNGLAFSPDRRKLYVVSFAKFPGDTGR